MRWTLVLGAAVLALALGPASAARADKPEEPLAPGQAAPTPKAEGWLNGEAPTEASLKGKVVVLDFFAFW